MEATASSVVSSLITAALDIRRAIPEKFAAHANEALEPMYFPDWDSTSLSVLKHPLLTTNDQHTHGELK